MHILYFILLLPILLQTTQILPKFQPPIMKFFKRLMRNDWFELTAEIYESFL
jgi:hypothetical protein